MTIRQGRYYPAEVCAGSTRETTKLLMKYHIERYPGMTNGGMYGCRTIAGSTQLSTHASGDTGDTMTGTGHPTRASLFLVEQMRLFSVELGIQGLIHNRLQWWCNHGPNFVTYTGKNPHVDHIHWERTRNFPLTFGEIIALLQGPSPTGNHLFYGMVGERFHNPTGTVKVQNRLRSHGFNIAADGVVGAKTKAAIIAFQSLADLTQDGVAGSVTQGRLQ